MINNKRVTGIIRDGNIVLAGKINVERTVCGVLEDDLVTLVLLISKTTVLIGKCGVALTDYGAGWCRAWAAIRGYDEDSVDDIAGCGSGWGNRGGYVSDSNA